jgi:hypothetical protein
MALRHLIALVVIQSFLSSVHAQEQKPSNRKTAVSIKGEQFLLNGQPTYAGRTWNGKKIEGLLLNSRMVQGTFDDLNPETSKRWTKGVVRGDSADALISAAVKEVRAKQSAPSACGLMSSSIRGNDFYLGNTNLETKSLPSDVSSNLS